MHLTWCRRSDLGLFPTVDIHVSRLHGPVCRSVCRLCVCVSVWRTRRDLVRARHSGSGPLVQLFIHVSALRLSLGRERERMRLFLGDTDDVMSRRSFDGGIDAEVRHAFMHESHQWQSATMTTTTTADADDMRETLQQVVTCSLSPSMVHGLGCERSMCLLGHPRVCMYLGHVLGSGSLPRPPAGCSSRSVMLPLAFVPSRPIPGLSCHFAPCYPYMLEPALPWRHTHLDT